MMEPVLDTLKKIKTGYGPPREGFEEFVKSCQILQPFYPSTLQPDLCQGYCIPEGLWLHDLMIQPFYDGRVMKAKSSDVLVVSFPKTGTTWTQEIAYLVLHNADTELANKFPLEDRTPFLEVPTIGLKGIETQQDPRLLKSHLPYQLLPADFLAKKSKIIYIARNPKDTVVSFYNFMRMVGYFSYSGTLDEFVDLFIAGKVVYSSFADHVLSFWNRRNDGNLLFLTYEELQKDLVNGVRQVANFLEKSLTDEQVMTIARHCSFENMAQNPMTNYSQGGSTVKSSDCELSFMRKGKVGDWKSKLTKEMNRKLDAYVEKCFHGTGCQFEYEM